MIAEKILLRIAPLPDASMGPLDWDSVDVLIDSKSITICSLSTFHFVKNTIDKIISRKIPGDILLAGVWRGGLAAYIQALLTDYKALDRKLYLADTFVGPINITDDHPKDKKAFDYMHASKSKSTSSAEEVKNNFSLLGLSLDNVIFLEGDIKTTTLDFSGQLAFLLVDVDFYTPTMDCLNNTYKNISEQGYIYVDDYHVAEFECNEAVDSFIYNQGIVANIETVNNFAIYWIKSSSIITEK